MTSDRIMGTLILHVTINAERYLTMLQNKIWLVVNTKEKIEDLIIMQDGASQHFAIVVHEWLNEHFLQKWLGQHDPHEWPARSPDLTQCNIFPLGWLKEQVHSKKPIALEKTMRSYFCHSTRFPNNLTSC